MFKELVQQLIDATFATKGIYPVTMALPHNIYDGLVEECRAAHAMSSTLFGELAEFNVDETFLFHGVDVFPKPDNPALDAQSNEVAQDITVKFPETYDGTFIKDSRTGYNDS